MMEGGQVMVVMIVAIVMIASIIRARYGYGRHGRSRGCSPEVEQQEHAENARLRDEVSQLKERIKVLERIAVDKENSLAKEIESLRDR
jgi:uncharacterized protein YlxW (UPF0749 family)